LCIQNVSEVNASKMILSELSEGIYMMD